VTSALLSVANILLPAVIIVVGVVVGIVVSVIGGGMLLGVSEMIGDEMRGWLELAPRGILRVAAMRLPADQRQAIYAEEWLPELVTKMRKGEERPISRFVIGLWYAAGHVRSAAQVARELDGVREPEPRTATIALPDGTVRKPDVIVLHPDGQPATFIETKHRGLKVGEWKSMPMPDDWPELGADGGREPN
jgi:hypothetical protein